MLPKQFPLCHPNNYFKYLMLIIGVSTAITASRILPKEFCSEYLNSSLEERSKLMESVPVQSSPVLMDLSLMPGVLLAGAVLLALLSLRLPEQHQEKKKEKLPGPTVLPLVGSKWVFWFRYRLNMLHEAYEDMFHRYGPLVVETCPGGALIAATCERGAVEAVLRYPARRPYRPPTPIVQAYRTSRPDRYASTGIVNEQGEKWAHLRHHLTSEITSPATMQRFLPDLNAICDDFVRLLLAHRTPDNAVKEFDLLTNRMGLESVCGLMLGTRLGFLEQSTSGRAVALAAAVKSHFQAQRDSYFGAPLWKFAPTRLYKGFARSEETIYTIVSELVEEARQRGVRDDMQEIFMNILENPELDMRDKKAAIIDFITAGIETLANSLAFMLHFLSLAPEWQARINSELPSTEAPLDASTLAAAPSLRAVMQESFRLLPTAPFLARVLEEPTALCGYTLPAGTFVLVHTMLACRREENFWCAKEFRPERWLEPREPHSPALVAPFGRGRRMCPGKRFVELELQLLLAKLMQKFQVELIGDLRVQFDFLLAPRSPVQIRLIDRYR